MRSYIAQRWDHKSQKMIRRTSDDFGNRNLGKASVRSMLVNRVQTRLQTTAGGRPRGQVRRLYVLHLYIYKG